MTEIDVIELEKNRQLAMMQREIAIATKKIVMDEMSHAARWIMASVLAVNSGGLIACLGNLDGATGLGVGATTSFYLGVAFAMIAGWKQIRMNQQMLPLHSRFIAAWEMSAIDGFLREDELNQIGQEIISFAKTTVGFPAMLCKLSFCAFSAGLAFLAFANFWHTAAPDDADVASADDR